jgi:CRP/FNR family transcriptional regulator, cyclic AMP receptor protein
MVQDLTKIIGAHPFFSGMNAEQVELIGGCGRNIRIESEQVIFKEGEKADVFYLVREGRVGLQVRIPGKAPVTIQTIESGDILGWSWIFPPYRTYFDARCVEAGRAVEFDGACLRGKCEDDMALAYELTKRFAQVMRERLRATRLQILDMYKVPVP